MTAQNGADVQHDIGTGATIFGCAGAHLTPWEAAFFRDSDPFGFILFARNVDTPSQVARLCADLRASVGRNAPILIDQEGGRVQRLRAPYWREWAPPLDMAMALGGQAARAMALRSQIICAELQALGIDANCAPVADIACPDTHVFLRNRCYGISAADVAQIARAVADAHLASGILPVVKHMPGHGRAQLDTHHDLPRVSTPLPELMMQDFAPFAALHDLPMAMTAHIIFDALDADAPATQSSAVIAAIRGMIGFGGLLITDDLNMQALSGTLTQRAAAALSAGCDIALQCNGKADDMRAVAAGAGLMRADSRQRATVALSFRHPLVPVDIAALDAEFLALIQGKGPQLG